MYHVYVKYINRILTDYHEKHRQLKTNIKQYGHVYQTVKSLDGVFINFLL